MDGSHTRPSPQLVKANQRLYALRAQAQAQAQRQAAAGQRALNAEQSAGQDGAAQGLLLVERCSQIAHMPGHLGWDSDALTGAIRRRQPVAQNEGDWTVCLPAVMGFEPAAETGAGGMGVHPSRTTHDPLGPVDWVKLYPDIGLGMLRQELTAPGRLWLALRYVDQEGRGYLRIANITKQFTSKTSALRLCGGRQLRNLLREGEGVFWTRDKERIWLRSAAKVAHTLGVTGLTGRPIALPLSALLDGIGAFRAHLYAAFHSSRVKETAHGVEAKPIARQTLAALSGVGRSSQRSYEERTGLRVRVNYAVGEPEQKERMENRAWQKGQALFELRDHFGQQGRPGQTYLAWQLPNSYIGQHQRRPRGRQRRINRELNDLVMKGMPGNVEGVDASQKLEKRYYPNGKLAAKTHGRNPQGELYWQQHGAGNGRYDLWQQLGG